VFLSSHAFHFNLLNSQHRGRRFSLYFIFIKIIFILLDFFVNLKNIFINRNKIIFKILYEYVNAGMRDILEIESEHAD